MQLDDRADPEPSALSTGSLHIGKAVGSELGDAYIAAMELAGEFVGM